MLKVLFDVMQATKRSQEEGNVLQEMQEAEKMVKKLNSDENETHGTQKNEATKRVESEPVKTEEKYPLELEKSEPAYKKMESEPAQNIESEPAQKNESEPANLDIVLQQKELLATFLKERNAKRSVRTEDDIVVDGWDLAGQRIYHFTHHIYFSDRCIYLLLFDLSRGLHTAVDDESLVSGENKFSTSLGKFAILNIQQQIHFAE